MKYLARVAGFIGRRVKAGEVFDFDGPIPWADVVEPSEPDEPVPKTGKSGKGSKKVIDDADGDQI